MINDLIGAPDEPVGTCTQHGGEHECPKWPDVFPGACCWLSCSELCGAACYFPLGVHGLSCKHYGGDRSEYISNQTASKSKVEAIPGTGAKRSQAI